MPASDFHESDLEEIFNMSLDMICVADINTATFTKVNPAFMNTLGYSEEELLGKPFLTFIHPDDVKPTIDVINEKLKQGEKVINFENRYRCKDGSYRWLDWTSHPVPERGITFAIAHDITELKRATEAEYQTILHTSMDGFWIVDVKGRFLDVNEAYCSLTGYSRDELLGMKIPDVEAVESPEEVKIHAEKGIKDGLDRFETKHRCKDGSVKDLEVSVTYHDSKGGRFVAFARDITERKRAEENLAAEKERLAVTLRSIGDGVITTDTYGIVKLMNRVAEELTGWKQEEAIEKPLREVFNIVNEITGVPCESPVEKVIATGSVVGLANHTVLISRDGRRRILADSGAPIRDRQCVVIGVVLVFRDVTQQRIMEEEIQKHQKIESLGILAGGIAHDFNNILTAILGNVSLAKIQRGVGEAVREKLAEAEKAVERAKGLTQQLLTFA
ncbi:MAG: PAS domain S-box protein, partial [Deltaproteobacteria bacterium]|nr:PAS domain S-box protein [Deltaproteobacteria bacterium]